MTPLKLMSPCLTYNQSIESKIMYIKIKVSLSDNKNVLTCRVSTVFDSKFHPEISQFNIPSKANNYVLKSDANGDATWVDPGIFPSTRLIYTGSVTASVNVATASLFQVTSGSNAYSILKAGFDTSGFPIWSSEGSLTIQSTTGIIRLSSGGSNSVLFNTNNTDRWFINSSGHLLASNENTVDIGTNTTGKVRNLYVTGSATINDVLVLPYQSPLPSGKPTGSIATSGSGATFVGLYLYNGTSWVKLSV